MIYTLLKLPIRLALSIFCVDIQLINPRFRTEKGPLLLVANHPNSFLDAIIIAAQFREPVHFLARGDAFRKPWHRFLLGLLHMIPVYRMSEGRQNLNQNEYAFKRSQELLSQNQIVLIFIEGICLHTHELQPFKKGAARIAMTAIKKKLALQIMPVAIGYHNFSGLGKTVRIELSAPVFAKKLFTQEQESLNMLHFNRALYEQLHKMIQVPTVQEKKTNTICFLFSLIGYFLHQPLYQYIKNIARRKTKNTVFYDSVLFGMLFFLYPLYLLILMILMGLVHLSPLIIATTLVMHPITAWFAVRYKIKPPTSS